MSNDDEDENGWRFPKSYPKVKHYIDSLMSYKHGRWENPYPRTTTYTKDELLALRPVDVRRWLTMRAYGTVSPETDAGPKGERASSLKKAKHGASVFMPNQHAPWLEGIGGNPTRHITISKFIADVEGKETKGLGKAPNDKRPYRQVEFDKILEMFRRRQDFEHRWKFPMMVLWAYHLIHRIDETAHFKADALHGNHQFPFAIFTKTNWSKNVKKMKQCPPQIILGSGRWQTCCLLNLSNYLEMWLGMNGEVKHLFTTNPDIKKGPANIKQQFKNRLEKEIWQSTEFKVLEDEPEPHNGLGTHSERKFTTDKASKLGAQETQIEYRGRWVGEKGKHIVNRHYIQAKDLYTDCYVASLLCDERPVKYAARDGLVITDEWLFSVVIPNIRQRNQHDNRFCRVMGLARLWGVFNNDVAALLPAGDVERIRTSYRELYADDDDVPVVKVALEVVQVGTRVELISVPEAPVEQQQQDGAIALQANDTRQLLAAVQRLERTTNEQFALVRQEQQAFRQWSCHQFQRINNNQRRFGGSIESAMARRNPTQQHFQLSHATSVAAQQVRQGQQPITPTLMPTRRAGMDRNARLEPNLRSLADLWQEYQFGIGNNKPARSFTKDEKNQSAAFKNKYSRRLKIWRIQVYLLNAGLTIEAANTRIINAFDTDNPTAITHCIINDQKNPNYLFIGGQRFRPRLVINNRTAVV